MLGHACNKDAMPTLHGVARLGAAFFAVPFLWPRSLGMRCSCVKKCKWVFARLQGVTCHQLFGTAHDAAYTYVVILPSLLGLSASFFIHHVDRR